MRARSAGQPPPRARPAAPDLQEAPDRLRALQRSAGNRATAGLVAGPAPAAAASGRLVQRGVLDAVKRGGQMYFGMSDEGAPFARELMRWRVIGLGADFTKGVGDSDWNAFMSARPEIQRAMVPVLEQLAVKAAADGPAEKVLWVFQPDWEYTDVLTGVARNELESMRLTLHGCHRIEVKVSASVRPEGADTVVDMQVYMTWIDRADLHPGTVTELDTGEEVDDAEFTAAGWDYDISISFSPPARSSWRVSGGVATHQSGWPPVTGAPQPGVRG
jgi:hypothetical protein